MHRARPDCRLLQTGSRLSGGVEGFVTYSATSATFRSPTRRPPTCIRPRRPPQMAEQVKELGPTQTICWRPNARICPLLEVLPEANPPQREPQGGSSDLHYGKCLAGQNIRLPRKSTAQQMQPRTQIVFAECGYSYSAALPKTFLLGWRYFEF
jgi:hypothetical protein